MCRGPNNHKYCVMVRAYGVSSELSYSYRTYKAAVRHTRTLNDKKQPRLSRWYNAPRSAATSYAKVMIKRSCKNG
jgi:hypothetical protein